MTKNHPVKTAIFHEKAYLIPIWNRKSAVFATFAGFWPFLGPPRHHWFLPFFHCSRTLRFSHGFWQKPWILDKNHEKHVFTQFRENVTEKPDTSSCNILVSENMKNWQFSTFQWGLDRGFRQFWQSVLSVCPSGVRTVQKRQKLTFP